MSDREMLEQCHAMLLQLTMTRQPKRQSTPTEFTPPSLEDVRHYVNIGRLNIDPVFFYNYFNNTGWVDANGKKVKNWKLKANTWSAQKAATQQSGSASLNRDIDLLSAAAKS
jgi:hypothetical protein